MDTLVALSYGNLALLGQMARLPPESPESLEAIAKRLRALRDALDLTQAEMATAVGSSSGSPLWAQYETAKNRIELDFALVLCRRYGITLDWIYRGAWHAGIPFDLAERIRFQEMKGLDRPKRKS